MTILHRITFGNILLLQVDANPDTSDTAPRGSLAADSTNGKLYINTDDSTAWTEFGVVGGDVTDPLAIQSNQEFPAQVDQASIAAALIANTAEFYPFHLNGTKTAIKMVVRNGTTQSGNIDVGIYDSSGTRQVSSGSTVQSGTQQIVDIADTVLAAGNYYMTIVADNIISDFATWGDATGLVFQPALGGVKSLATAFPLPVDASAFIDATLDNKNVVMSVLFEE